MNAMSACFEVVQYAQQHLICVMQVCLWRPELQECFLSEPFSKCLRRTMHKHKHMHTDADAHSRAQ